MGADGPRTLQIFVDDEETYRVWTYGHQVDGYVVSDDNDGRIHSAGCEHIFGGGDYTWTRTPKVCSTNRFELEIWTKDKHGTFPQACGFCNPG